LLSDTINNVQQFYVCSKTNTWSMTSAGTGLAANRPVNCLTGQIWLSVDTGAMTYCSVTGNPGTWSTLGGTVTSVSGTANQITSTGGATPFLSLSPTLTLPGKVNKITLTAPTTAWTIQPAADNQTTIIPGGTLSTATVTGSSVLKGSGGNAVPATAADVVTLFSSCSGTQYLGADGACHTASGSGTMTVVGAGNLTSTAIVTGGGAQAAQTPSAAATVDSAGNIAATSFSSPPTGAAGSMTLGQGTPPSSGTTAITLYAPSSVTSYKVALPGAAATGLPHWSNSSGTVTESVSAVVAADTDTSIAHTGVDINTSHQVTATHLGSALPAAQGGTGVGNTATLTLGSSNQNWATLGTGIVKNTTATGALSNAISADVIGLFTGCSGTQYLAADGSCHTSGSSSTPTLSTQGIGWLVPFGRVSYMASYGMLANTAYVQQFVCCTGVNFTVRTVGIPIMTSQTSSNVGAAIYADSSGAPGSLLAGSGGIASTSIGAKFAVFGTPFALTQGTVYWLALSTDTANVGWGTDGTNTADFVSMLNETSHPRMGRCTNSASWSGGTPTFNATCGALTAVGMDRMFTVSLLP
jgi:hypothetical protein